MASLTKTIKSLRKEQLKAVDEILAMAAGYAGVLTRDEEDVVDKYRTTRFALEENLDNPIVTIAEIAVAKKMLRKERSAKKDKRF